MQSLWQQLQSMANCLHQIRPELSSAKKVAIFHNALENNQFGAEVRSFFCSLAPVVTSVNQSVDFVNHNSQFPGHPYPPYNYPLLYLHESSTLAHPQTGTVDPATLSVSEPPYGVFTAQLQTH